MTKSIGAAVLVSALFVASGALAQGMLLDFAADNQEIHDLHLRGTEGDEGRTAVGEGEDGDRLPS
jgi:hypothetical protein